MAIKTQRSHDISFAGVLEENLNLEIDTSAVLEWVADTFNNPEDVYDAFALEEWARINGFVREE